MKAQNLLCGAIVTGDLVLVQSLLRGGQSPTAVVVNKENAYFGRPLHLAAASEGYHRSVRILLNHGADVNQGESPHTSALINAVARGGHGEAVRILLNHGASSGEAFISAADGGQVHLLQTLLQKREVDVHAARDNSTIGMQALERAIITKISSHHIHFGG